METTKEIAIKNAIKKVDSSLEMFFTFAFDCEFVRHGPYIKDKVTGISYSSCNNPKAVGYIDATSKCHPERCPLGKES